MDSQFYEKMRIRTRVEMRKNDDIVTRKTNYNPVVQCTNILNKTHIVTEEVTTTTAAAEKNIITTGANIKLKGCNISCRICLGEEYDMNNPLINPCKCSGTMKFIHLLCLRVWLQSKVESRFSSKISIYKLKNIECELCKTPISGIFFLMKMKLYLKESCIISSSLKHRKTRIILH